MKFNNITLSLAFLGLWCLLTNGEWSPFNPPLGRTGAPGELTCATSDCHDGGDFTGTVAIQGIPDTVEANQLYTVTLIQSSNALSAGFQLTCLDGNLAKSGILKAGSGSSVAIESSTGRQYVRQFGPKDLLNGSTSWTFSWQAPATAVNDSLRFYFVSLAADQNGSRTGDNALLGNRKVVLKAPVASSYPNHIEDWVKLYLLYDRKVLNIDFSGDVGFGQVFVFDIQGQQLQSAALSGCNNLDVSYLTPGVYVVQVLAGGRRMNRKFIIE